MSSPGYSFKYDEMRQNDPTQPGQGNDGKPDSLGDFYALPGHVRNVCFIPLDCPLKFLNYAYLVSGGCTPDGKSITLTFTSDVISLNGLRLIPFFFQFMRQLPQIVTCTEARYNAISEDDKPIVNDIQITSTSV